MHSPSESTVCSHAGQVAKPRARSVANPAANPAANRGVALIITLLLLTVLSLIGLTMVLTSSTDMMINGYYRNYRGAFYAADSGMNVARQQLLNQVLAAVPSTYVSPPISTALTSSFLTAVMNNYSSFTSINTGQASGSWSGAFEIVNTATCTNTFGLAAGSPTQNVVNNSYTYQYNYTLCITGRASGLEQSTVAESGSFFVTVASTPATYNASFAIFGAFIDAYPPCLGPLVPGTMTGTMFTNGAWGFMPGGQYIFTDPVGQANPNASYFDSNWNCYQSPNSSFSVNGQTIAPQFQGGFNVGQKPLPLPPNDFSQKEAVLDGTGLNCVGAAGQCPTNAQMNAALKDVSGTAYPAGGASSGVFMSYSTINGQPTITGGGFLVEGNASITLTPSGASGQVYTISQGSPAVITTITVNSATNQTVVQSGAHTLTLTGVPTDCSAVLPAPSACTSSMSGSIPGTMLYVDGTITSMSGPGEGQGAIQNGTNLTITALGDINITGDVIYVTEPVTTAQNQIPGTPVSTLIPGNDHNQDLGIYTANGSIYLSTPYGDGNLQVDGSQAVIGQNCQASSCGFYVGNSCPGGTCAQWPAGGNYQGSCINTFNNVGGQAQSNIFGACMNTQNTYFDRRYTSKKGFAPPWFPGTTISTGLSVTTTNSSVRRTQWVATSSQ